MYREVVLPNVGSSRRTRLLTEKEAAAARADEMAAFNAETGAESGCQKITLGRFGIKSNALAS